MAFSADLIGAHMTVRDYRHMKLGEAIAARVSASLAARGWTHGELALRTKITQPSISAIANGTTQDPKISSIEAIAAAFGSPLSEFLDWAISDADLVERLSSRAIDVTGTVSKLQGSVGTEVLSATERDLMQRVAELEVKLAETRHGLADLAKHQAEFQTEIHAYLHAQQREIAAQEREQRRHAEPSSAISFLVTPDTEPDVKRPRGRK